jgi:hypothetical protein
MQDGVEERMRFFAVAMALVAMLAVPAYAQQGGKAPHPDDVAAKQRADEADRGYKMMIEMQKGRTPEGKLDPWANIRQPADAAPPAKGKKPN